MSTCARFLGIVRCILGVFSSTHDPLWVRWVMARDPDPPRPTDFAAQCTKQACFAKLVKVVKRTQNRIDNLVRTIGPPKTRLCAWKKYQWIASPQTHMEYFLFSMEYFIYGVRISFFARV